MFKPPFNWFNKFGSLPASYKEAMSYEEQIMWLCKEVQRNESYAEEFQTVIDQINESISKIDSDLDDVYLHLNNKQDNLTAGNGILLQNNTISTAPTNLSHLLVANGYIDFSNVAVTDVLDLTPVSASNSNYLILETSQSEKIELVGKLDLAIVGSNNQILTLEKNIEASSFDNPATVDILDNDTKLVVSFYDTNTNPPDVRLFMSADFIYDEFQRKQDKLIAGSGITLNGNVISANANDYVDISSLLKQNQYIDFSNKTIGDTLSLEPVSATNTAYYIKEVALLEQFKIVGNYILAEIDNENKIVNKESGTATSQNPYIYTCMAQLPSKARFVITFENTDISQPSIYANIDEYYLFNNIEGSKMIRKLKADLQLVDSSPDTGLLDGFYFSDGHKVYVNNVEQPLFNNALFYASGNDSLYLIYSAGYYHQNLNFYEIYYNRGTNSWNFGYYNARTNWENVFDRPSINNFTQDLNLVDGTNTTGLADGIYFTDNYKVYINGVESNFFNHAVILSYSGNSLYVISSPYNARQPLGFYEVYYNSQENKWKTGYQGMQTDWSLVNNRPSINNFTQDLNLVDGTGTTGLANGLYYTGDYHVNINGVQSNYFDKALILSDTNNVLYVIASPYNNHQALAYYEVYYDTDTASWSYGFKRIRTNWSLIDDKPAIATSITSSSTNDEIAGAKAVFDKTANTWRKIYNTNYI